MTATQNEVGRRSGRYRLPAISCGIGGATPPAASYAQTDGWRTKQTLCGPPDRPLRHFHGLSRIESLI
jgi:hypothetical protein